MLSVYLFTLVFWFFCWLTYVPKPTSLVTQVTTDDDLLASEAKDLVADFKVAEDLTQTSHEPVAVKPKPLPSKEALTKPKLLTKLKDRGKWKPEYDKLNKAALQKIVNDLSL